MPLVINTAKAKMESAKRGEFGKYNMALALRQLSFYNFLVQVDISSPVFWHNEKKEYKDSFDGIVQILPAFVSNDIIMIFQIIILLRRQRENDIFKKNSEQICD